MDRPSIPEEVKRQLRQEAGFGCCFCGYPFYDYHHINPWARKNHHDADDMMLVCPNHHRSCTLNAISEIEQRAVKSRPHNVVAGHTKGKLFVGQRRLQINVGSNLIEDTPNIFVATKSQQTFMAMKVDDQGILNLTMQLIDKNGQVLGQIFDNEWTVALHEAWDLKANERHVSLRAAPRDIVVDIDARNDPVRVTGNWKFGLVAISAKPSSLNIGSNTISGGTYKRCSAAFGI